MAPLRWGICSAAKICNDFLGAMSTLPEGENIAVAIAARSKASAQAMADTFNISNVYEGYSALATDPTVDVVYIGTVNSKHFELIKLFISAGKHVFCEKTMCLNNYQTEEVYKLAKDKKLFLAEAMWSRYLPSINKARELIRSRALGEIVQVQCNFGYNIASVERISNKELGGGALLDLGIYSVMGVLTGFDDEIPSKVNVSGTTLENSGVDSTVVMSLEFSKGRIGIATCNINVQLDNTCTISCEKGRIVLPDFWSGNSVQVEYNENPNDNKYHEFPIAEADAKFNFNNSSNMRFEIQAVRKAIQAGNLETDEWNSQISTEAAKILTQARHRLGYKFEFEK